MQVRKIKYPEELDLFFEYSKDKYSVIKHVQGMLSDKSECGYTNSDYMYICIHNNKCLASIYYWYFSKNRELNPSTLLGGYFKVQDVNAGISLLLFTFNELKISGIKEIEWHLASTNDNYSFQFKSLLSASVPLIQEKIKYCYNIENIDNVIINMLSFKTIDVVGKKYFIDIFKKVTVETLDSRDEQTQSDVEIDNWIESLINVDNNPSNYLLAYIEENCVGLLIIADIGDGEYSINYIGVVPDFRGNKISKDLIVKAISIVKVNKGIKLIAEIDKYNFPLVAALEKSGFQKKADMAVFVKLLNQ